MYVVLLTSNNSRKFNLAFSIYTVYPRFFDPPTSEVGSVLQIHSCWFDRPGEDRGCNAEIYSDKTQ